MKHMKKQLLAVLLAALTLLSLSACGNKKAEEPVPPPAVEEKEEPIVQEPAELIPEEPEDPIDLLLSSMTLEEKVGQLFFVRCPAENAVEDVGTYHLGGYLLFGRDFKDKTANEIIQNIASYQEASPIPLLIGVDEEGGTVVRVSSNPNLRSAKFRAPQKILAASDGTLDLAALTADTHEKDLLLKALGINVNFAPVVDVAEDPNSFMYDRTFGQDASMTAECAQIIVEQMSLDSMGSVLKHFPGYGDNADTHTGIAIDTRPAETFTANDELKPFLVCNHSKNTSAILVSHNIVENLDSELPSSLSPAVHQLLRQELNFDGVTLTDDLAMDAVAAYSADGAVAVMALQAGNDMVVTTDYRTQIPKVLEAVENGTLDEEAINTACRRVLTWKQALGLL